MDYENVNPIKSTTSETVTIDVLIDIRFFVSASSSFSIHLSTCNDKNEIGLTKTKT